MNPWTKAFLWLGGGALAILISTAMNQRQVGYAFVMIGGIIACVYGLRIAIRAAVHRDHQAAVVRSSEPAITHVPTFKRKHVPVVKPPEVDRDAEAARLNAFFADATNTVRFRVDDMLADLHATREHLRHHAQKLTGTADTGYPANWQTLARQVASNVPLAAAQNAVVAEMPNFTVKRTLFRMSNHEKEIYRIMALLNAHGSLDRTYYRNFQWGMVFGGGTATIEPTGARTEYTEIAKTAITDYLTATLSEPNELIDGALAVIHEMKKNHAEARAREEAATSTALKSEAQDVKAVQAILDDI